MEETIATKTTTMGEKKANPSLDITIRPRQSVLILYKNVVRVGHAEFFFEWGETEEEKDHGNTKTTTIAVKKTTRITVTTSTTFRVKETTTIREKKTTMVYNKKRPLPSQRKKTTRFRVKKTTFIAFTKTTAFRVKKTTTITEKKTTSVNMKKDHYHRSEKRPQQRQLQGPLHSFIIRTKSCNLRLVNFSN